MSRFKATPINTPSPQSLVPYTIPVIFNRANKIATGLDSALNTEAGAIACANDGGKDCWFNCRSHEAATEVLEPYYNGEYLTLKWFTKK